MLQGKVETNLCLVFAGFMVKAEQRKATRKNFRLRVSVSSLLNPSFFKAKGQYCW